MKRICIILIVGMALVVLVFSLNWFNWFYEPDQSGHLVRYDSKEAQRVLAVVRAQIEARRTNAALQRMPHMVGGYFPMNAPTGSYVEQPDTNDEIVAVPVVDPKYANPTNWPDDSRREVQAIYQFAKIAKLSKFDPVIIHYEDANFPHFTKDVATATHDTEMDTRTDRLQRFASKFDSMESAQIYDGVTASWGEADGTWDKHQMIEETLRIVTELGSTYAKTLAAVSQGQREVSIESWPVKLPDGTFKTVYPFATVKLFGPNVSGDPNEPPRVTAEYRMGSDGTFSLVYWSSLY